MRPTRRRVVAAVGVVALGGCATTQPPKITVRTVEQAPAGVEPISPDAACLELERDGAPLDPDPVEIVRDVAETVRDGRTEFERDLLDAQENQFFRVLDQCDGASTDDALYVRVGEVVVRIRP